MQNADVRAMLSGGVAGLVAVSLVTCTEPTAPKTTPMPDSDVPVVTRPASVDQTLVWVDATGRDVAAAVGDQEFLRTVDEEGLVWQISPRTGSVADLVAQPFFADEGCNGEGMVDSGRQPRRAFRIAGQEGWFTAPDDEYAVSVEPGDFTWRSWRNTEGACIDADATTSTGFLVAQSDLLAHPDAEPPNVDFEPPLHVELR